MADDVEDRLKAMSSTGALNRWTVTAEEWFRRIGMSGLGRAQDQGRRAESMDLNMLRRRGWRVLNQNWSCRWGELDLPHPQKQNWKSQSGTLSREVQSLNVLNLESPERCP